MLTLKIENEKVENIFLNEFNSNKDKFFEFIQSSYEKIKITNNQDKLDNDLIKAQEISMSKTWNNDLDEAWDEL